MTKYYLVYIANYLCKCGALDAISPSCAGDKQFYPGLGDLC